MTKAISLLGATGSIGRQTLQVARELGLAVAALTANRQVDLLEQQAREFRPALAVLYDREAAARAAPAPAGHGHPGGGGAGGPAAGGQLPQADTVVTAVMGSVGLEPTLAAIRAEKAHRPGQQGDAGLRRGAGHGRGGALRRGDRPRGLASTAPFSSACRAAADRSEVRRLILTCSGGPFFGRTDRAAGVM